MNANELITERICALLEAGTVPWRKPWRTSSQQPTNLRSQRAYRGINVFLLACAPYASPYWVTFRQAAELGGSVRKGEHGYPVVLWRWVDRRGAAVATDDEGEPIRGGRRVPLIKAYTVFNLEQCDGLMAPPTDDATPTPFVPLERCDAVCSSMPNPPTIHHGGFLAFYQPSTDAVTMPPRDTFTGPEAYYAIRFHELVHATGHEKRLARRGVTEPTRFADHEYSREELVAEMGAAFLCGHAGISPATLDNQAAYLASWLKALRGDAKLVIQAAASAQKAADLILGREHQATAEAEAA